MKAFYLSIFMIFFLNISETDAVNSVSKTSTIQKTETKLQSKKKLNRWQHFKTTFRKKKFLIKKWLKKMKKKAFSKALIQLALIFGLSMFGATAIFLGSAFVFSLLIASANTAAILAGIVAAVGGYILTDYLYRMILKEKSPWWFKIISGFFVLTPLLVILIFLNSD